MTEYGERELVLPTLAFLASEPDGLTTSQLIRLLVEHLRPDRPDMAILGGRRDTHFSQKVRNLVSHDTLTDPGWVEPTPARQPHRITDAGRAHLAAESGMWAGDSDDLEIRAAVAGTVLGDYRRADETRRTAPREPFEMDPDAIDRASTAHAATQNAIADWVRDHGWTPRSSVGGIAEFDIAWEDDRGLVVVEVKSLTPRNETKQLRLGLGQVLHYGELLRSVTARVRPALAVEREPADTRGRDLCRSVGVQLVWPEVFDDLSIDA